MQDSSHFLQVPILIEGTITLAIVATLLLRPFVDYIYYSFSIDVNRNECLIIISLLISI